MRNCNGCGETCVGLVKYILCRRSGWKAFYSQVKCPLLRHAFSKESEFRATFNQNNKWGFVTNDIFKDVFFFKSSNLKINLIRRTL